MLRGHGPLILESVSKTEPMTANQIITRAQANSVCRAPGITTIHRHLAVLLEMGCLEKLPGRRYLRVVDSEFDLPQYQPVEEVAA